MSTTSEQGDKNGAEKTEPLEYARQHGEKVVKAGLATIGSAIQKMNLSKFMPDNYDDTQQVFANKIKAVKREADEEMERQRMIDDALQRCKAEIDEHLTSFLFLNPEASYEEWIQDLHPENVAEGKLLQDFKDVDLRFYVADSDHRLLWNARVPPERQVEARTYKHDGSTVPVDLFNHAFEEDNQPSNQTNPPLQADISNDNHHSIDLLGEGWPWI